MKTKKEKSEQEKDKAALSAFRKVWRTLDQPRELHAHRSYYGDEPCGGGRRIVRK